MAAEYILSEGNSDVMLCERGIRTFETATRNTLDLNAVPVLKKLTHLPGDRRPDPRHRPLGVVSPHGQGRGIAAGADGLMIEVHMRPEIAVSDGVQSLKPDVFRQLMRELAPFAQAAGRKL